MNVAPPTIVFELHKLQLIKPAIKFKKTFLEAFNELESDSDRLAWNYLGDSAPLDIPKKDFARYVQTLLLRETEKPKDFVCDTTYWAIVDDEIVGRIAVRHELNEALKKSGGHIGYIVRPSYRGEGIAPQMLKKLLEMDFVKAIGDLLLTTDENNIVSEKTILKNGGVFERIVEVGPNRTRKKHFWIKLK